MLSREIKGELRRFGTPFYLYDMELLRRTVEEALAAADRHGYMLHYALKANNDARILQLMRSYGLGADCVSGNEVRAAVEAGFDPRGIVYAGVGKKDSEILYALGEGIFSFNCESRNELTVIDALAARIGMKADVALRINPGVDARTHRHITTGLDQNKFGISRRELEEVAGLLPDLGNVNVIGLHFHIGSQITDMEVFRNLCRSVNSAWRWFEEEGFRLSHVNLGGGLGIDYSDPDSVPIPDFEEYFGIFAEGLDLPSDVKVHFEPGRSLVAQCGELISEVLYLKTNGAGREIALIDASMTELVRPAMYDSHHAIENLDGEGRPMRKYMIGGTACESSDIFANDVVLPELRRGDLVSIKSAGAYGASMASRYNLHDLPAAVYSDELLLREL